MYACLDGITYICYCDKGKGYAIESVSSVIQLLDQPAMRTDRRDVAVRPPSISASSTMGGATLLGSCLTGLQGLRGPLGWEPAEAAGTNNVVSKAAGVDIAYREPGSRLPRSRLRRLSDLCLLAHIYCCYSTACRLRAQQLLYGQARPPQLTAGPHAVNQSAVSKTQDRAIGPVIALQGRTQ